MTPTYMPVNGLDGSEHLTSLVGCSILHYPETSDQST